MFLRENRKPRYVIATNGTPCDSSYKATNISQGQCCNVTETHFCTRICHSGLPAPAPLAAHRSTGERECGPLPPSSTTNQFDTVRPPACKKPVTSEDSRFRGSRIETGCSRRRLSAEGGTCLCTHTNIEDPPKTCHHGRSTE